MLKNSLLIASFLSALAFQNAFANFDSTSDISKIKCPSWNSVADSINSADIEGFFPFYFITKIIFVNGFYWKLDANILFASSATAAFANIQDELKSNLQTNAEVQFSPFDSPVNHIRIVTCSLNDHIRLSVAKKDSD